MESDNKIVNPVSRPDLSFITSQKFETKQDYQMWFSALKPKQKEIVNNLAVKFPAFVAIAEMQFDNMLGTPAQDSIVFQVVSETLNAAR